MKLVIDQSCFERNPISKHDFIIKKQINLFIFLVNLKIAKLIASVEFNYKVTC